MSGWVVGWRERGGRKQIDRTSLNSSAFPFFRFYPRNVAWTEEPDLKARRRSLTLRGRRLARELVVLCFPPQNSPLVHPPLCLLVAFVLSSRWGCVVFFGISLFFFFSKNARTRARTQLDATIVAPGAKLNAWKHCAVGAPTFPRVRQCSLLFGAVRPVIAPPPSRSPAYQRGVTALSLPLLRRRSTLCSPVPLLRDDVIAAAVNAVDENMRENDERTSVSVLS